MDDHGANGVQDSLEGTTNHKRLRTAGLVDKSAS